MSRIWDRSLLLHVSCSIAGFSLKWPPQTSGISVLRGLVAQPSAKTGPYGPGDITALSREAIVALPAAVYMTDTEGRLIFYNEAAAELWGCPTELGESRFCGSWKLYRPDGTPLPHDQCAMAMALHQRRPIRGMEAVAERPDGTRVPFVAYPTPLFDASGRLTGAVNVLVDISERKRTEVILEERDAQFELASRIGQIGTFSYNYRTRILHLSPELAAIHGLPREITQKDWRALVHPDDLQRIDAVSRQALADRQPELVLEFRIIRPDGKTRWIESRILVTYNDAGRAVQMIGANIDVTARKQTEQALAESNAQLALAAKAARVGCYANNLKTGLITVSEDYAAIHGLPEGTAQTTLSQWRARVHPDDLGQFDELCQQILVNRRHDYTFDYRIISADGEVRWIESRGCVSYDEEGQPQRCIGINIDVTERKQAETRLSDALTAGRVVAFEWDALTGQTQRSDNAERILGIVQDGGFLRQVHPADRWKFNAVMGNLSPSNPSYALTFRFVRSDSRDVWLEEEARGEFDATGKLLRIKGLTRDITERKELEDHKSTLISELDHRVKNVLATVSAVASHTQEASSSMAEFVAALDGRIRSLAITHELLSSLHWQGIPLAELIRRELAPYATVSNTHIGGPDVVLSAEAGQVLAMVFHELATNAAKFGAISGKSGRVSVRWSFKCNGGVDRGLAIRWEESGGPPVVQPARSGFGASVVRDLVPYELGGTVELMHLPKGVCCNLHIPAHWLTSGAREASNRLGKR